METTFTNNGKPGSSVLSANNNIKIKFKNCTFVKCAGFTASRRSVLTIENCLITNSEYVLDQALILVSDDSFISIHRSNLLDNKPDVDIPFLRLYKSNATMNECWYTGNVMSQHFMLIEDSLLAISDTHFNNNSFRIRAMFASFFYLAESKILIQDSLLKNNNYYTFIIPVTFVAIFDAYSSDITLNSCQIVHDTQFLPPDYTIHMRFPVFTRIPSNFLQINNCTWNSKSGTLLVEDVANINVQNSFFLTYQDKSVRAEESGFQLGNAKNVRIANCHFKSRSDVKTHIAFRSGTYEFNLLTFNTTFTVGNYSFTSSEKNFLEKAEEFGIVKLASYVSGSQIETPYASSKTSF